MRVLIYDIEVFPDTAIVVFKDNATHIYDIFEISHLVDDRKRLADYILGSKCVLVGYNSKDFDDPLLCYMINNLSASALAIKIEATRMIDTRVQRYKPWEIGKYIYQSLDMMEILNMGITSAKTTSLKQWEFNLRKGKILDLPYNHYDPLVTRAKIDDVIEYCKYDVDVTHEILHLNKEQIEIRREFGKMSGLNHLNDSEVSLAKKYITKVFSEKLGIEESDFRKLRTYRDQIDISSILLPKFSDFNLKEHQDLFNYYNSKVLYPTLKSAVQGKKKFSLKKVLSYQIEYPNGLMSVYGTGGIHGCVKPGIYQENDDYCIVDFDFASYYPHLIGNFNIEPKHLPKGLLGNQLLQWYKDRNTKYPKKTHYNLNYTLKIILNLCYGQYGSEYSPLFDQQSQVSVCINGMLFITKLIELAFENNGNVIYANTDGIGVMIKRSEKDNLVNVLNIFADSIGIELENVMIKKWFLLDVNNYIVINQFDEIKEKGLFETYDTIVKHKMFWKSTSSNIIPLALYRYFISDIPIEYTIFMHNDIFDFCKGVKGGKGFDFMTSEYDFNTKTVRSEIIKGQRMLRYYITSNGYTLSKLWKEGSTKGVSVDSVEASAPVKLLNTIKVSNIHDLYTDGTVKIKSVKRFPNLNRDWYIAKCMEIVNTIEGNGII